MFERMSAGARQVMVLSQEASRDLHHGAIDAEHLALGVLRNEDLGARVLGELGVTPDTLALEPGSATTSGQIPFTPRAKAALEGALREAMALGHDEVEDAHLALALVRTGVVPADLTRARELVVQELDGRGVRDEDARALLRILERGGPVAVMLQDKGVSSDDVSRLL